MSVANLDAGLAQVDLDALYHHQHQELETTFDTADTLTWPGSPAEAEAQPEPGTLAARYATLTADVQETTIFDSSVDLDLTRYQQELVRVLTTTFVCIDVPGATLTPVSLVADLAERTNYAVESVVRVMNKAQYRMHKCVAETFKVHTARTVFHGTSETAAPKITATGFKTGALQRALYGRGVYTSPDVWTALAYAEPEPTALRQVSNCSSQQL